MLHLPFTKRALLGGERGLGMDVAPARAAPLPRELRAGLAKTDAHANDVAFGSKVARACKVAKRRRQRSGDLDELAREGRHGVFAAGHETTLPRAPPPV